MSENQLLLLYPEAYSDADSFTIPLRLRSLTVWMKKDWSEYYCWNEKGQILYGQELQLSVEDVLTIYRSLDADELTILLVILQNFRDRLSGSGIAGFEELDDAESSNQLIDIPCYQPSEDIFWSKMKRKYSVNVERSLKIVTYGSHFLLQKCQKVFNAAILRGSSTKRSFTRKMLIKLRGTDPRLQHEIRESALFEEFVEKIIQCIENENLHCFAVICRAGHHRSVAIAEMLIHLYPHRTVEHLTINQ